MQGSVSAPLVAPSSGIVFSTAPHLPRTAVVHCLMQTEPIPKRAVVELHEFLFSKLLTIFIYCIYLPRVSPFGHIILFFIGPCIHYTLSTILNTLQFYVGKLHEHDMLKLLHNYTISHKHVDTIHKYSGNNYIPVEIMPLKVLRSSHLKEVRQVDALLECQKPIDGTTNR